MWWDSTDACRWPFCVKNACVAGGEGSCPIDLHASMPIKMEALSDTCLQIPCSFDSTQPNQFNKNNRIVGVWLKSHHNFKDHPESVVFIDGRPNNRYPIRIIGNMSKHNCTTVFTNMTSRYADVYYFRVVNIGLKGTDICRPLTITVKGRRTFHFYYCHEYNYYDKF